MHCTQSCHHSMRTQLRHVTLTPFTHGACPCCSSGPQSELDADEQDGLESGELDDEELARRLQAEEDQALYQRMCEMTGFGERHWPGFGERHWQPFMPRGSVIVCIDRHSGACCHDCHWTAVMYAHTVALCLVNTRTNPWIVNHVINHVYRWRRSRGLRAR